MLERNPTKILRKAIYGMLGGGHSRGPLRNSFIHPRLRIYTGPNHPHMAQLPAAVECLPRVPQKLNGDFHFGLKYYAHPNSYQEALPAGLQRPRATK